MKKIMKDLLLIGAVVILASCGDQGANAGNNQDAVEVDQKNEGVANISGTFKGAKQQQVFLELLRPNAVEPIDTVLSDENGDFSIDVNLAQSGFYRIGLGPQNLCVLILSPDEEVKITADASNIYKTYQISGSSESQGLLELNKILAARDSVGLELQEAQLNQDREKFNIAMAAYQQVMSSVSADIKAFIDQNPARLCALAAAQNLDPAADFDYFIKVVDALDGIADGLEFYDGMKEQVQRSRKLAAGAEAPDFELPQPDGSTLKLSDLRGQYVLIDFWASWCGPCRRENPNVVRVYKKYHEKGFEILGVSLDKNRNAWLAAIEQDELEWKHVSDLKYWNSAVVPEYQVEGIPLTYLIDPEGKIVAKNLRGSSLEQKLAEIFDQ